mgnify:CR=1 FL=1
MDIRRIKVPVATIWKRKDASRPIDKDAVQGNGKKWVEDMSDQQTIELCDDDLLSTQALFNDEVIVDKIEDNWARVFVVGQKDDSDRRGYPGWVPLNLLTDKTVVYPPVTSSVRIAQPTTELYDQQKNPIMEIVMGTTFSQIASEPDWLKVSTPLGDGYIKSNSIVLPVTGENGGDTMINIGKQFLGKRYLWGGTTPYGFDCSGFVYALHRVLGFSIPRDADDQQKNGINISTDELMPGDLVFFAYEHGQGYVHHVGMYIGQGKMIESRTPGKVVDIASLTEPNFASQFAGFRRYWR